jgi:hypothetical protein
VPNLTDEPIGRWPAPDPGRACGGCTACCTVFGVAEIAKGPYEACAHAVGGCAIYASRPAACRGYYCLWLAGVGRNMERPDRAGYVLDEGIGDDGPVLVAHEVRPGAFDDAATLASLAAVERRLGIPIGLRRQSEPPLVERDALARRR